MTFVISGLALLVIGAAVSMLLIRAPRLGLRLAMSFVLLASLLVVIGATRVLLGSASSAPYPLPWLLPLGAPALLLDALSAWFLLTIGILGACVGLYAVPYMSPMVAREPVPVFCALFCGLLASLILLVCAADAVLFLVGWEAMSVTAFLLVAFHHERPEVRRGAWMYLVATHLGTALFVLPLFGILYAKAGTTAFSAFLGVISPDDHGTLLILFVLGLIGFGTKAGMMPMHVWLPAAHPVAPTPVSTLLSGVVVKTGIYGLLRLLSWLPPLPLVCGEVLLLVGVVSGVWGVLYALGQHDLKRLLAYHTVENIGIIALGIAVALLGETTGHPELTVLGFAGALLHVTNHALFKGLLFLSAGAVLHGCGTADIDRLGGLARKTPFNAILFLVGAVAICALPPLNGFLSEWVIYGSLFAGSVHRVGAAGGLPAGAFAALALMGGLALACFAKVFGVVFLGELRDQTVRTHPTPAAMKLAMAPLAALCVLIGLLPGLWLPLAYAATAQLADRPLEQIAAPFESVLAPAWKLSALAALFMLLAAGLAVLRRRLVARAALPDSRPVPSVATWGCGFARPTPRMQYTAASFAAPLVTTFRSLLWPEKVFTPPAGAFPVRARMETHAPDIAEQDFFVPIFRGVARLFAMLRTVTWRGEPASYSVAPSEAHRPVGTLVLAMVAALRRGSIQLRLLFIVLTLMILFLLEAISPAGHDRSTRASGALPAATREVDR